MRIEVIGPASPNGVRRTHFVTFRLPLKPWPITLRILGKTLKASSIKRKMTAISQRHETAGYSSPTKAGLVRGVWDGIQRSIGVKEEGKEALLLDELRQIIQTVPQDKIIGVRNRALLVLSWAGALRRSELVTLDAEDISITRMD